MTNIISYVESVDAAEHLSSFRWQFQTLSTTFNQYILFYFGLVARKHVESLEKPKVTETL